MFRWILPMIFPKGLNALGVAAVDYNNPNIGSLNRNGVGLFRTCPLELLIQANGTQALMIIFECEMVPLGSSTCPPGFRISPTR